LAVLVNDFSISNALNTVLALRSNISLQWRIETSSNIYPVYGVSSNIAQQMLYGHTPSARLFLEFRVNQTKPNYYPPTDELDTIDKNVAVLLKHLTANFISRYYSPLRESDNVEVHYALEVGTYEDFFFKLEKAAKEISDSIFTKELEVSLSED
jgi:hypothetical protein